MTVRLRPVTEADLPLLDGGDSPYDSFGPRAPRSSAHDPSLTAELGGLTIADDDAVLGNVSWVWQRWGPNAQSRNPMIGIWLAAAARGRGAGTEAQRQLVDLFFLHTAVNRIEAHTDVENLAEQSALEKVGFRQEGVTRGAQWREGAYHDGFLYSILRADWASR
ncbi:Protein N-acetyltransferase, RimJ/RimL family [Nocardioides terrae]|uniref:Protein N-acetyltransferase, RimJ/RimL family n=1 Tax=Nocardioides terrae TaxID=574651 RepID=A0A1I1DS37_9ACTN|nr:GNAT family protein [Nocardioides terrae]SFB77849.1 Protein N-acetyltransferase, RimJ/RimL family [Nocardioides terrae]